MRPTLVSIGILLLAAPLAHGGEKQRFFLTHPGGMAEGGAADIHLSSYRLNSPAMKRLAARGKLSPRRWVDIENAVIYPGHGEGIATIDGKPFRVRYAWKGLSEWDIGVGKKDFHTVLGWTVRIEGPGLAKHLDALREGIVKDENGGRTTVDVPMKQWLASQGVKTLAQLRAKRLKAHAAFVKQALASADPEVVALGRKIAKSGPRATAAEIASLRGKTSVAVPVHVSSIEPWTLRPPRATKAKR